MLSRKPFDPREQQPPPEPAEAAWYVVQFDKHLTSGEKELLRANYDLRLTDYVPNFAFLEWLTPETWHALTGDDLYRAGLLYKASDKISPRILTPAGSGRRHALLLCAVLFPSASPDEFIKELKGRNGLKASSSRVRLRRCRWLRRLINWLKSLLRPAKGRRRGEDETRAADTLSNKGKLDPEQIKVLDHRPHGGDLQVIFPSPPREKLLAIARLKEVRWIEEQPEVNLDSVVTTAVSERTPAGLIQSGQKNVTPVWDQGIHGEGQIIGVTDHAINPDQCMFSDCNSNTAGSNHRKLRGLRQNQFDDGELHGHRVAALAAGHDVEGELNHIRGMAWGARLSLDDVDNLLSIFQTLIDQDADGAFIHSYSSHMGRGYNCKAVEVDQFVFNNERHLVCGSSGNRGEGIGPPGSAKNALCVSASMNVGQGLEFGDGGDSPISADDERLKPDICAPGGDLGTAGRCKCEAEDIGRAASSWATPIVAGAAALVRQYYLEGWYPTGLKSESDSHDPSGALVKATLLNSTVNMTAPGYPSFREGWGLLRLSNTLFFAGADAPRLFMMDIFNADGLEMDQSHEYDIYVEDDSRPLKVTLVWSDDVSKPPASPSLVNPLNLIVTAPDGTTTFQGKNFDADGLSIADGEADSVNNVQMVIRDRQLCGTWHIKVHCAAVNGTTTAQGYALVVTGSL